MTCAIVAIPNDRESVWKYSSEKIPHMTLLFLGDQSNNPHLLEMIQFVEHVSKNSLSPFGMSVKSRGVLGPDNADVLFFEKRKSENAIENQARNFFLSNDAIKKAYLSIDQYPEWTPHLTMGYPTNPAKKDDRDYSGFGWIEFDKIAVWTGDFTGPTFTLEYPDEEARAVLMNDRMDAFLEHHGVKGMKWGVRNDKGHEGEQATTKKIAKEDKKFEKKNVGSLSSYFKVYNAASERMNNVEIARINSIPKFKGKDFTKDSPLRQAYYKEYSNTMTRILNEESDSRIGTNASGTKRFEFSYDVERGMPVGQLVDVKKAKHAVGDPIVLTKVDSKGYIISIKLDTVEHSSFPDEFLAHYGVLGMKWGHRNSDSVALGQVITDQKKPGSKVTASGGKGFTAHPDAARAAAAKQVAKKSTTDALSNQELQALVTRMNLEQQYSKLSAGQTSPGKKFVTDILTNAAKQEATKFANAKISELAGEAAKKAASR